MIVNTIQHDTVLQVIVFSSVISYLLSLSMHHINVLVLLIFILGWYMCRHFFFLVQFKPRSLKYCQV